MKIFCGFTENAPENRYSFLTIDTTLPARDPLRLEKICFLLIKMTVTDQLKIIDNKIKANQAQYDLDRLAAKISAYSSGDLRKYEYLTGEDLGYKPSVFEQAKFDYSPLGNIFTKGLDKDDQKEGLFKRLENIKDKNEELLNVFSAANNKVSKATKIKVILIVTLGMLFNGFIKTLKNLREWYR